MQCNWLAIVRGDGGVRACVFCGQHKREHSKRISVASVLAMLNVQEQALQEEIFARTLRNMCQASLDSHVMSAAEDREAQFSACLCCHHWVARRSKKRIIFPLQALSWYVNTMQTLCGKNMDHRVVMRLCEVLCQHGPMPPVGAPSAAVQSPAPPHPTAQNTYCFLFNNMEKELFARIATGSVDAVGAHIADFYHVQNACTMFTPSCALVEKLRKSQARRAAP
jgi:hypothetical protein